MNFKFLKSCKEGEDWCKGEVIWDYLSIEVPNQDFKSL